MFWSLQPWPVVYVQTAVMAFVLSVVMMPLGILCLRKLGMIDAVSESKIHQKPTPRGAGVFIFLAFVIAVLLPNYRDNPMKGVLVGGFICLVVGAIDDYRGGVPAIIKFAALVAATFVMSYFGVRLNLFHNYPLDLLVTLLWIVGVTSAFNGVDNMDGLASGIAVIVSTMYLAMAVEAYYAAGTETSLSWFGLLAAGLIGANLGFLLFNFKPARVFMGDSGSFFLGFTLSALGVMGEWNESPVVASTIPILILGVPLFDFAYIIVARILRGETKNLLQVIEHCATDHLSHRLVWIGFSQRKAVLLIYLITTALGITGLLLHDSRSAFGSALGLIQGFAFVAVIIVLMGTAERRSREAIRTRVELLRADAARGDETDSDDADIA